jgi:hypothetical protein
MTESPHPDIDVIGSIPQRPLEFGPYAGQRHRVQALDLMAGVAIKVRVDRMVLAGQFIVAHPGVHEESAHYAPAAKILQDAVDCHLIDPRRVRIASRIS